MWVSYLGVLSPGATPCPHQKGHQNGEGEAWPCSDDTKHQTHSAGHTRPALTCSTRCLQKGLAVLQDSVPGTLGSPVCPIWEAVTFPQLAQSPSAWHGGRRGAGSPPFSTLASASTSRAPVGSPFPLGVAGFLHPLLQRQGPPGRGSEDHPSCSEHQHPPSYREAGARAKRAEYPRTARAGNSFIGQGHRAWHAGDWTVWRERGSRRATPGAGWGRGRASGGLSGLGLGKHRVAEVALAGALGIRLPDRGLRGRGAESGAGRRRARPGEARTVPTAPSPAPPCTSGSGSPWAALPAGGPPCRASSTCGWGLS